MILLQIVMVSPGTHLVKNHESLSITNEPQYKKTGSPKLKMVRRLCNQTVDLETDAKTLYLQFTDRRNHMNRILYQKKSFNQSIILCVLWDARYELFCIFWNLYASGTQDAEVTKSLSH